jgi:hypothetical protein
MNERPADLHARSAETRTKRAFNYCETIPIQWIEDFEVHDVWRPRADKSSVSRRSGKWVRLRRTQASTISEDPRR